MRRTFLTALLLAAIAAVVFAPSAMTKKEPSPAGVFALTPYSTITLTGMTLTSDDDVFVQLCAWYSDGTPLPECEPLGGNSGALGQPVSLANWEIYWPMSISVTLRVVLQDYSTGTNYTSDGMTLVAGQPESGPAHASLGWTKDGAVLLSMNDGSQNPSGDSVPVLGAGNFNAIIRLTAPEWPVTITNITGYSDGATVESGQAMCSFHAVMTYTSGKTLKKVTATGKTILLGGPYWDGLGYAEAALGASPFNPGTFSVLPTNLMAGIDYQFMAVITGVTDTTTTELGAQFSTEFRFDPTTFVDGCPPAGQQLVTTSFGE